MAYNTATLVQKDPPSEDRRVRMYLRICSMICIAVQVWLLLAPAVLAAIATDGSPVASGVQDGQSSVTLALTVNSAGSTIVVGISSRDTTDADRSVSSVTWQGSSTGCAQSRTDTETATSNMSSYVWRCVDVATGSGNLVVTMAGVNDRLAAGAIVLTGVDTASPDCGTNGSTSTTAGVDVSTSVTTTSDNCWVFDAYYDTASNTGITMDGAQTQLYKEAVNAGGDSAGGSYKGPIVSAGSTSMTWVNDTSGAGYTHSVAAFNPSIGGAACTGRMLLMGVGSC